MAKALINNFSKGIVNDPRDTTNGVCRVVTGFDVNANPRRLVPFVSSEDGDSAASTSKKQNFCTALWLPGSTNVWRLFGLGVVSGTGRAEIMMKDLTTGAATDLDDNSWATPTNNQSASGTTNFELFVYYKKTGLIYGAKSGTAIWAFDPTANAAFAESTQAITYTTIAQGIVHSKDDVLYVPYDNKIASNNNGTWTVAALTLPSQYYITSICEFNNYLAIAAAPLSGVGNSRVYMWDRNSALTTVTENIDWGSGVIKILEEVEGYLVGISIASSQAGGARYKERIIFRYFTGASALSITELTTTVATPSLPISKQKINGRLYFLMNITLNGTAREGVWSFGRSTTGAFTILHERTSNNDTALGAGTLRGFIYIGDFLFISYNTAGGTYALSKTYASSTFSATSIYESQINPGMADGDKLLLKQLNSVAVAYETLSGVSGQIVLKYRVDGGSYTTVLTATTTGVQVAEEIKDASGTQFLSGREYEFRIESTLGANVTALLYDYTPLDSPIK